MKTIWLFNQNRRVYPKAPEGKLWASGGPIYREHWEEHEVAGENRVSWITKSGRKVPKKGGHGIAFSLQELEDDVWRNDHRYHITQAVEKMTDVVVLRQIAKLVGYCAQQSTGGVREG